MIDVISINNRQNLTQLESLHVWEKVELNVEMPTENGDERLVRNSTGRALTALFCA
jgi:hypothetical protein